MEIKKEDFVRFHIVNTVFYALPVSFFKDKKVEVIDDVAELNAKIAAEAEELRLKKEAEAEKKILELAEKKRLEALKAQAEAEALAEKKKAEELRLKKEAEEEKKAKDLAEKKRLAAALEKTKKEVILKAEYEAKLADLEE